MDKLPIMKMNTVCAHVLRTISFEISNLHRDCWLDISNKSTNTKLFWTSCRRVWYLFPPLQNYNFNVHTSKSTNFKFTDKPWQDRCRNQQQWNFKWSEILNHHFLHGILNFEIFSKKMFREPLYHNLPLELWLNGRMLM